MSQVERLRKALEWLFMSRPLVPDEWWYHQQDREAWKDAVPKAQAVLDATSGPTDMEELAEWLKRLREKHWKELDGTGLGYHQHVYDSIDFVLDFMRRRFNCGPGGHAELREGDDATE